MHRLLGVAALIVVTGCTSLPAPCPAGLNPMVRSELFFGRNVGTVEGVSDAAWQQFLEQEISPRFPDGFTVLASDGQWRGNEARTIAERGYVVHVIGEGSADELQKLHAIRAAYRGRFMQDLVLLVRADVCAGF